jgi:hypothetical protein
MQVGGNTLRSEVQKPNNFILNKEELPQQWKELIILPIYKRDNKTDCRIIGEHHSYQLHTKFYPKIASQS